MKVNSLFSNGAKKITYCLKLPMVKKLFLLEKNLTESFVIAYFR